MKKCNKCGAEKEYIEFHKRLISKDGYRNSCKLCFNSQNSEYKIINSENIKLYWKKYRNDNSIEIKERDHKYYLNNKDVIKEKTSIYGKKNKEKRNENHRERVKNDFLYKSKKAIRALIGNSIKRAGGVKINKTSEILGCSVMEFKFYIENKFESWMDWNNYGIYNGKYNITWQLDHIIPLDKAKTEEEIIKLNHYTNFQPLCSRKNLEKRNIV